MTTNDRSSLAATDPEKVCQPPPSSDDQRVRDPLMRAHRGQRSPRRGSVRRTLSLNGRRDAATVGRDAHRTITARKSRCSVLRNRVASRCIDAMSFDESTPFADFGSGRYQLNVTTLS